MSARFFSFNWYFCPGRFEANGRLYHAIGIEVMGKVVRATVGALVLAIKPRSELYTYFVTDPFSADSIKRTERWSRFNEIVHLLFTIFCLVATVQFSKRGYMGGVVLMSLFGVLNLYLILLQRLNRVRMYRMIALLQKRSIK